MREKAKEYSRGSSCNFIRDSDDNELWENMILEHCQNTALQDDFPVAGNGSFPEDGNSTNNSSDLVALATLLLGSVSEEEKRMLAMVRDLM